MPDYRRRVGARIRRERSRAGLTQSQLARILEVEATAVSRWERGLVMPSPTSLHNLEQALGVPAETFLRDDGR
jgi:transcriptional regulator with XRE-family HTH domain